MLFIYWIEDHPDYAGEIKRILSRMQSRGDQLCSSAFGLGEVLVGARQRATVAEAIRTTMRPPDCDGAAAEQYAAGNASNEARRLHSPCVCCVRRSRS